MPFSLCARSRLYRGVLLLAALAASLLAVYHSVDRTTVWRRRGVFTTRLGTLELTAGVGGSDKFGALCPGGRTKADREWPTPCNASQPLFLQRPFCRKHGTEQRVKASNVLPEKTVDQVKCFVLFIGHAHSGTSITGAMLDAHPNVVLANEHYTLHQLAYFPNRYRDRQALFSSLYARERSKALHFKESTRKGYSLFVNGSAMGRFEGRLGVIGDKAAGATVGLFLTDPVMFKTLVGHLKGLVGVPLKFVHVIRNPFDNIATAHIYKLGGAKLRVDLIKDSGLHKRDTGLHNSSMTLAYSKKLDCTIQSHFDHATATERMGVEMGLDVLQMHLSDLVHSPLSELGRLCSFLGLECDHHYLEACQAAIFTEVSRTRDKVHWTQSQIAAVERLARQVPSLERYSFNSE